MKLPVPSGANAHPDSHVEQVRKQTRYYLDRYGWDVAENAERWRNYQRRQMAAEYPADEW